MDAFEQLGITAAGAAGPMDRPYDLVVLDVDGVDVQFDVKRWTLVDGRWPAEAAVAGG